MIKRRPTKQITVGSETIGSKHPIVIQSMTKTDTTDVAAAVRQINRLKAAGCRLVRIAVPTRLDTAAFKKIVEKIDIPLIADIHFSPARAIEAIEAGAAKIRLNPGNIKNTADINRIIDCAKTHKIAVRIGINEASIRDLKNPDITPAKRTALMIKKMQSYVRIFEKRSFDNIVLSVKSSDVIRTIQSNRAIADRFDYPLHLGLTHAGLPQDAIVPSTVAVGTLLSEGIGDTIRISLAGDPVKEVRLAQQILSSLGLYPQTSPTLTVCPTCGRCKIDVVKLAKKIKKQIASINKPLHIAVMGCIVNGPGEAGDADLAVCAAKGKADIYKKGKKIATVKEDKLLTALTRHIETF